MAAERGGPLTQDAKAVACARRAHVETAPIVSDTEDEPLIGDAEFEIGLRGAVSHHVVDRLLEQQEHLAADVRPDRNVAIGLTCPL